MSCGVDKAVQGLKDNMKSQVDGLTKDLAGEAEAGKGLLDQLSSLKAKAEGMVESVSADLLAAVPPLPEPLAGLQDSMGKLLANPTDPSVLMTEMNDMAEKFGTDLVDQGLAGLGIDPAAANEQLNKFKELKAKGQEALEKLSQGALNLLNLPKDVADAINVAQGDLSSLASSVQGVVPSGFDPNAALDKLCAAAPNVEIAADGSTVTKGVPTTVPSKDAKPAEPPEAPKDVAPPAVKQTNQFVKQNRSIDVVPMTRKRSDIFQAFRDRSKYSSENIFPQAMTYKSIIKQAKDTGAVVSQNVIDKFNSWKNYYYIDGADNNRELHNEYKNNGFKYKEEYIPTFKIEKAEFEEKVPDPEVQALIRALKYIEILEDQA